MTSSGMPTNKILFSDIIKFLIATIIILLWFLWKTGNIWETSEDLFFADYLSSENGNIEENTHQSAENIVDLCQNNSDFCNKITIENWEDVLEIKNEIYQTSHFIQDSQIIGDKITDTLQEILVKSDDSQRRWYATRNKVVFNIALIEDIEEFRNLSTHELGHVFDLWVIQWRSRQKSQVFTEFNRVVFSIDDPSILYYKISRESEKIRKKTANKKDFCSGYWMTNPFEDFAECFNLFINNQNFFKTIARQNKNLELKYRFIATLLQWQYLSKNTHKVGLLKNDINRRPRDTTKF